MKGRADWAALLFTPERLDFFSPLSVVSHVMTTSFLFGYLILIHLRKKGAGLSLADFLTSAFFFSFFVLFYLCPSGLPSHYPFLHTLAG